MRRSTLQFDSWEGFRTALASTQCRAAVLVYVASFLIYLFSPMHGLSDSNYSMMLSEQLYRRGSWDLSAYFKSRPIAPGLDQLRSVGPHLYYEYPPGSSVLSIPLVFMINQAGFTAIGPNGEGYDQHGEFRIERIISAVVTAGTVLVFFLTASLLLSQASSLFLSMLMALATPIWSTASSGLGSHTWGILLLSLAIYLVLMAQLGGGRINPFAFGTLLSWLYFVRPTFSISILYLTLFVMIPPRGKDESRGHWVRGAMLLATGAFWLAVFVAWSRATFGDNLPPYYQNGSSLSMRTFWVALAGHLISPSRGLWIFSPWLIAIPIVLFAHWKTMVFKHLATIGIVVVVSHWLVISAWPMWWFGHCFGPRAFTDVMPWFGLLLVLAVNARQLDSDKGTFAKPLASATHWAVAASIALGIGIHGSAAISPQCNQWNNLPIDVDVKPDRVWDWSDSQALAIFHPRHK